MNVLISILSPLYQNGIVNVLLNYIKHMDKKNFNITITCIKSEDRNVISLFEELGCEVIELPNRKKNILAYIREYNKITKRNFNVVHINGNSATMVVELYISKRNKILKRIAHSHNSTTSYPILHRCLYPFLNRYITDAIACSELAGNWIFNKEFRVLKNAIDIEKYYFNEEIRLKYRKELNIEGNTVIGQVARFNEQKNHEFTLHLFKEFKKNNEKSKLILVGKGPLLKEIKTKANEIGLESDIIFLEERNDIEKLMQAFDILILPSKWEGLGMVLMEAQASGLPCCTSCNVPKDVEISSIIKRVNLDINDWINTMNELIGESRVRIQDCIDAQKSLEYYGYSISKEAKELEKIYK